MAMTLDEQRARDRAVRIYPRSKGFRGAYLKGARAALAARPSTSCPYAARAGWSAWRIAWMRGHQSITLNAE